MQRVAMQRYRVTPITAQYWRPGEDYIAKIVTAVKDKVGEGDFVVISEKALSTATGNILDESLVEPSWGAKVLAGFWMRYVWVYILGPLSHLRRTTIKHLRNYPPIEGSIHKQVALQHAGPLQALMHGSEGGIDGSNLPYSFVSLPLSNAHQIAEKIHEGLKEKLNENVGVMIVDTDKSYSWRSFHFTPRPNPVKGIKSAGGVLAYVCGRFFRLQRRATPLAIVGVRLDTEEALEIAELANRARGCGAGRTVWDMADTFRVPLAGVSWEMLERIRHKPIVIVRMASKNMLQRESFAKSK